MKSLILASAIFSTSCAAFAAEVSFENFYQTEFKKYPALRAKVRTEKPKLLWKENARARLYRTALIEEWKTAKGPNFAGHYFAVDHIGCGTGCRVIFIVDWDTGKIIDSPDDQVFRVIETSRLLILKSYDECTSYGDPEFYVLNDGVFKPIAHATLCK